MNHIYITGDIHGETKRITDFVKEKQTTLEDILIILGDVAFNYFLDERDFFRKEELKKLPITIFCIHGNHECRPYHISSYKEIPFYGGTVYQEKQYPNLLFAKDGEIFYFNNKKYLVIGGAYSIDKYIRLTYGYHWWEDEQPSLEIRKKVEENLEKINWNIEGVFSHTCPLNTQPCHLFLSGFSQNNVDASTEIWLQELADKLSFQHWYFGHYHSNWKNGKYQLLFDDIIELTEKEIF